MNLRQEILKLRRAHWSDHQIAHRLGVTLSDIETIDDGLSRGYLLSECEIDRLYNGKRYGGTRKQGPALEESDGPRDGTLEPRMQHGGNSEDPETTRA